MPPSGVESRDSGHCMGGAPTITTASCLRRAVLVLALGALAAPASIARAQVLYGSVVGNVSDSTGSAVPGATVTVTNTDTGATRDTVTDGTGAYRFTSVQPGNYT